MDLITLEANVNQIFNFMPMNHGIGVPVTYFDYKANRPWARVFIGGDFEKSPADLVKSEIIQKYYLAYGGLKDSIPDLSEDDFVLQVRRLTSDADRQLYAECKHGAIIFH